jgi:predicted metal-dependent enzyme (double-stranded beta helix superfamily)
VITYFSHEKVDASFAKALASTGGQNLLARKDRQDTTYSVLAASRGKSDEGVVHSHKVWTGIVILMSGAATFCYSWHSGQNPNGY